VGTVGVGRRSDKTDNQLHVAGSFGHLLKRKEGEGGKKTNAGNWLAKKEASGGKGEKQTWQGEGRAARKNT